MRRIPFVLAISILTTAIGVASAGIWLMGRQAEDFIERAIVTDAVAAPEPIQVEAGIPNLSLCELIANQPTLLRQVVHVQAVLVTDEAGDRMELVDSSCSERPVRIEATCYSHPEDSPFDECQMMKVALDRFLGDKADRKPIVANVDVVARFAWFEAYPDAPFLVIKELNYASISNIKITIRPKRVFGPC
jgi:hypothetical protein